MLCLITKEYGTGYAWKPAVLTVKEGDIVQWVWAVPDRVEHQGYQVIQTPNITSNMYKEGGFRSGQKLSKGSYVYDLFAFLVDNLVI